MNKVWKDECAARLQPLVDKYKPIQHETFLIEKFQDLIVITQSCLEDKKPLFKKMPQLGYDLVNYQCLN